MALKRRGAKATQEKATENESSIEYTNLEDGGEYEGRLVYVADLGLQKREFKGDVKPPCQKLSLGIEIIGEPHKGEDGKEFPRILWTNPFNVFWNLTEKGKELEYYKMFDRTASDGDEADWEAQLSKPVSVVVEHAHKKDKTFDNIAGLAPIPEKYQSAVGEAVTEPSIGDANDEENACTKALFGLAKWVWNNRIDEVVGNEEDEEDDYPPFNPEDDIPF